MNSHNRSELSWAAMFDVDGFACLPGVASSAALDALAIDVEATQDGIANRGRAGRRNLLRASQTVREWAASSAVRQIVNAVLGPQAGCVRALWFDKTPDANWQASWHQDLTIAVAQRRDAAGFTAWSVKQGAPHVRPPVGVLQNMATLRLHVDDCDAGNGPLRVLPGSHGEGVIEDRRVAQLSAASLSVECCVARGGCVLMRPLLVHSSLRAAIPRRRRVLHLEFAACSLPAPLTWYDWA